LLFKLPQSKLETLHKLGVTHVNPKTFW
jgi:hypothetical protein